MTCHFGDGIVVCTTGDRWFVSRAACPWCSLPGDPPRRQLEALVFSGWCGSDFICGACGQEWSSDMDGPPKNLPDEKREENKARVAAVPDPTCWECHDSGWIESPIDAHPCERCEAGRAAAVAGEEAPK